MRRHTGERGLTLVETLAGAATLALCATPILGSVIWLRQRAAGTATDTLVLSALESRLNVVRSQGRTAALGTISTDTSQSLGQGVTLVIATRVAPIVGKPRLYDVRVTGAWNGRSGASRSLVLQTYVFSPDN